MSFEIRTTSGESRHPLSATNSRLTGDRPECDENFVDESGCTYLGFFDGSNVIFRSGSTDYVGRWLQGTAATVIRHTQLLPDGFIFNFMDHGNFPQRLHAVWEFGGSLQKVLEAWKLAGFSVSNIDRHFNQNHSRSSTHLRTKGAFITGADSSHVVIPPTRAEASSTSGEIHVGEFNPCTGFGIGFLLHRLEG